MREDELNVHRLVLLGESSHAIGEQQGDIRHSESLSVTGHHPSPLLRHYSPEISSPRVMIDLGGMGNQFDFMSVWRKPYRFRTRHLC